VSPQPLQSQRTGCSRECTQGHYIQKHLLFLEHLGEWDDPEGTVFDLLLVVSLDGLQQLENPRLDQPLEIFVVLLLLLGFVGTDDVHLDEEGETAEEVHLPANLSNISLGVKYLSSSLYLVNQHLFSDHVDPLSRVVLRSRSYH